MTDQFEHSRVNEPTSDLFELLPNDKTSRSLLYLNKKIVDKKESIKHFFISKYVNNRSYRLW